MQFLNLLLLTSSYFLFVISFIPHYQAHYDEVYEKDKMSCFFVYWDVDPTIIARDTDGKAVLFHEGVLRNYKITTVPDSRVNKRLEDCYTYTVVEECGKNVNGTTYLIPKDYYDSTFAHKVTHTTVATDEKMRDKEKGFKNEREIKVLNLKEFSIEVTIDNKTVDISCNSLVAEPYAYDV